MLMTDVKVGAGAGVSTGAGAVVSTVAAGAGAGVDLTVLVGFLAARFLATVFGRGALVLLGGGVGRSGSGRDDSDKGVREAGAERSGHIPGYRHLAVLG